MKKLSIVAGIAVLAVILSACAHQQAVQTEPTEPTGPTQPAMEATSQVEEPGTMMQKKAPVKIALDAKNYEYSQEMFDAEPGDTVELTLTVTDGMHDFKIDELGAQTKVLQKGQSETISFTIPQDAEVGTTYEYYCSVGNHKALGMVGKLVVRLKP